jgi:thiosulfate/3-mercaptopyruvate sulfurtransferase
LEVWEKVLVDTTKLVETRHGNILCTYCHGGENDPEKAIAHTDLIADPSDERTSVCWNCHIDVAENQTHSLHFTVAGYETVIRARSEQSSWDALDVMMGNHCENCHASCGQCHISQPTSVGGGLLDGHMFVTKPPMTRTCTACHGSRVGNEYLGKNEGLMADVHFRQARMVCVDCHVADEMHGAVNVGANFRYEGDIIPACTSCHPDVTSGSSDIPQHQLHGDKLSCQVCHSVEYKSCDGCHTALNDEGTPYFHTEGSYMTFYIGRNPIQTAERPFEYVPVRHVPITPDSFEYYGENLLTNFDALPTWRYTTPHNIQRQTPQNASCEACHGNDALFLTADKVVPGELNANLPVIVDQIPPPLP